jgi:AAA+ ATPase superfamily predicted ATPase
MTNPFVVTERYVGPEYFCDRETETAELLSNIVNGRNTVLISLRRMGKSGLVSHLYNKEEIRRGYECFFLDIYDTTSIDDFVLLFSKEVVSRLQSQGMKFIEKFISIVNSMRVSFGSDPVTGQPSIEVSLQEIKNPVKTLEQIFSFLESSSQPCVVTIDEFQQIADYKEGKKHIATLRTLVQSCVKTRFIFSGSNRRMMSKLFNSPSEPFFMSSSPIMLEPINKEKYVEFVSAHFGEADKPITTESIEYVYERFDGHTWFIQYVFNRLYEMSGKDTPATKELADEAVSYILSLFSPMFKEIFARMSEKQRALLVAISKERKVTTPTGEEFISKYSLRSASAVQGAMRPLIEDETIAFNNGLYFITNRFFSLWLSRRY